MPGFFHCVGVGCPPQAVSADRPSPVAWQSDNITAYRLDAVGPPHLPPQLSSHAYHGRTLPS